MALEKLLKIWQGKTKTGMPKNKVERRKDIRLVYSPTFRPVLKIKKRTLEVLDISEKGMKILNYKQFQLGEQVSGTAVFSSGKKIELIGKIKWQLKDQFGIFVTRIPKSVILEEVQMLLKQMS